MIWLCTIPLPVLPPVPLAQRHRLRLLSESNDHLSSGPEGETRTVGVRDLLTRAAGGVTRATPRGTREL